MLPDDKARFATAMNWLAEKFPKRDQPRKLTAQDLADYFDALKSLRIDAIEFAAKYHFANKEFFPRPCELKEWAKMAPAPKVERVTIEETPASLAKEKTREIWRMLDEKYGTTLADAARGTETRADINHGR